MKAVVFQKFRRGLGSAGSTSKDGVDGNGNGADLDARTTESSTALSETNHSSEGAQPEEIDARAELMSRQLGSLNVWKAPVNGPPLRYARRCSRSPSPIPKRKVSFRLSQAQTESSQLSLVSETENLGDSLSSGDASFRFQGVRDSANLRDKPSSVSSLSSSASSTEKSSLKVSRQSISLSHAYDPILPLLDDGAKRVAFSSVSVHLHCMILGDNPAVSVGLPVQIDWKAMSSFTRSVDEYESGKDPPRPMQRLKMGPIKRERILKENGSTPVHLLRALHQASSIQASRAENAGAVSFDADAAARTSDTRARPAHRSRSASPTVSRASQRIREGRKAPKAPAKAKIQ
jgi:hypothetical protein